MIFDGVLLYVVGVINCSIHVSSIRIGGTISNVGNNKL